MHTDLINIALAFLEGLALIASPCILPILPIVLSASLEGSRRRPYGVIVGFIVSFSLFTLFSRQLVLWFGLDPTLIRNISFVLLLMLGGIMVSSFLTEKFNNYTQVLGDLGLKFTANDNQSCFAGGVFFGILIGLIWTPCAGPILAAVIVQTILQHSNLSSLFTILAFALGAAIPMLFIVLFGRAITNRAKFLQSRAGLLRKVLGWIIIIAVISMYFGNTILVRTEPTKDKAQNLPNQTLATSTSLEDGLIVPYAAPDFQGISAWINSKPLHMHDLRGKVVLIDFWAFSCINCIRTLPYLIDWYTKYHDQGLVIVGVHSPEFDFERDLSNVQDAVKKDNIAYPVAVDNDFATWRAYNNQFWPAHYLIDKNGMVVYTHFGEGKYDVTENNIRYLLGLNSAAKDYVAPVMNFAQTPETYFGYARSNEFSSPEDISKDRTAVYSFPKRLHTDQWALQGSWRIEAQKIVSTAPNAQIKIKFAAQKVFAVMGGAAHKSTSVRVMYNGVHNKTIKVDKATLYTVLSLPGPTEGELELIAQDAGVEFYTFTFG